MKRCAVVLILFFIVTSTRGQGISPIVDIKLENVAIDNFLGQDSLVYYSDTTLFNAQLLINVYDTTTISKLVVELYKDKNDSVSFQKIFDFDVSGVFTDGTSYSRNVFEIILGLGDHYGLINPKVSLVVQRIDGTNSIVAEYY